MKKVKIAFKEFSLSFGERKVLSNLNLNFYEKKITALFGPSGGGKTILLKSINRLIDVYEDVKFQGDIYYNDKSVFEYKNVSELRRKIGFVSQKPQVLKASIFENLIFGLKLNNKKIKEGEALEKIEKICLNAGFWNEFKNRLNENAEILSMGQKQKICIARALSLEPDVLLLDEPTSDLDPISAAAIEDMLISLKESLTIIIATHNLQQASKISDYSVFLNEGKVIECDKTLKIFSYPSKIETENFLKGKI